MIDEYNYTDVAVNRSSDTLLNLLDKYKILHKKYELQSKLILKIQKIINSNRSYQSKVISIYSIMRKTIDDIYS